MEGNLKEIVIEISHGQLEKIGLDYIDGSKDMIILDGLKISKEVCVNVWKIPKTANIERAKKRLGITELSKIHQTKKQNIFLVKKRPSKLTLLLEKNNLYYEFPIEINKEGARITIRGESDDLNIFFSELDKTGLEYNVKQARDYMTQSDILSSLTEKQRNALILALKEGYFKTPRKTDAHALAKKLGIRHTTFLQHLRRAQEKILERVANNAS